MIRCIHGVPKDDDEKCFLCDIDKRFNKLEKHHTRQIDENRKISRRVDELESDIKRIDNYLEAP
jgi:hypothetical protein